MVNVSYYRTVGTLIYICVILCQNAISPCRDSLQHHTKSVVVSVPATHSFLCPVLSDLDIRYKQVNLDTLCDKLLWWFKKREYKHAC